jgi:hypothetical protein
MRTSSSSSSVSVRGHGVAVEPPQGPLHELAAEEHVHVDGLGVREREVLEHDLDPSWRHGRSSRPCPPAHRGGERVGRALAHVEEVVDHDVDIVAAVA